MKAPISMAKPVKIVSVAPALRAASAACCSLTSAVFASAMAWSTRFADSSAATPVWADTSCATYFLSAAGTSPVARPFRMIWPI